LECPTLKEGHPKEYKILLSFLISLRKFGLVKPTNLFTPTPPNWTPAFLKEDLRIKKKAFLKNNNWK